MRAPGDRVGRSVTNNGGTSTPGTTPSLSAVPVAAAVSILTPRLCHCLYESVLPPGTLCVLYTEGQEDKCEVCTGTRSQHPV